MLSLKGVTKISEKGNRVILDDVSLDINPGDYVVIQGGSNSAKKMLGRLLGAVDTATVGEVYVDGVEMNNYSASELSKLRRDKFSCLFMWQELDDTLTVKENVILPLMYAGKKGETRNELAERALTIVGMQKFLDARTSKLNYWQKNKVLLARAIVTSPRVLIVEEPCRIGDESKVKEVIGLLSALNKEGITIIVITSRSEYEEDAKRVLEIENGKIVEKVKLRTIKKETAIKAKKTKKKKTDEQEIEPVDTIDIKEDEMEHSELEELAGCEKQLSFDEISSVTEEKKKKGKEKRNDN